MTRNVSKVRTKLEGISTVISPSSIVITIARLAIKSFDFHLINETARKIAGRIERKPRSRIEGSKDTISSLTAYRNDLARPHRSRLDTHTRFILVK